MDKLNFFSSKQDFFLGSFEQVNFLNYVKLFNYSLFQL